MIVMVREDLSEEERFQIRYKEQGETNPNQGCVCVCAHQCVRMKHQLGKRPWEGRMLSRGVCLSCHSHKEQPGTPARWGAQVRTCIRLRPRRSHTLSQKGEPAHTPPHRGSGRPARSSSQPRLWVREKEKSSLQTSSLLVDGYVDFRFRFSLPAEWEGPKQTKYFQRVVGQWRLQVLGRI